MRALKPVIIMVGLLAATQIFALQLPTDKKPVPEQKKPAAEREQPQSGKPKPVPARRGFKPSEKIKADSAVSFPVDI